MPEGIIVHKKEEIFQYRAKTSYLCVLFGYAILGILLLILSFFYPINVFLYLFATVGLGLFFFPIFSNRWEKKIPTGRYKYIVSLAPEVSYTELTDLYNVSKNEDGTYTLKEKEGIVYAAGN